MSDMKDIIEKVVGEHNDILRDLEGSHMSELQQGDGYQVPSFDEWFQAKYLRTFDDLYCHGYMSQGGVLIHHIRHSREYMQEQLQAIADHAKPPA
ncbi:hypothetical protein N7613_00860 [Pseudomonas juntendi]|uniref:hypothetical protein n=1 Tax=Pseudomonas TaxID=286 RepID=UPI0018E69CE8|nr:MULTISPECIES: hypothetical protein [Pseudomonas]MBI6912482.1 hypothetical protein [Pseudomonas juntendi]MDG9807180.1 hypothetical protein [Pseudomonas juntendi]